MRGGDASSSLARAVSRHVETLLMFLDGEQRTSREEIRHSRASAVLGHVLHSNASDWSIDKDIFFLAFTQQQLQHIINIEEVQLSTNAV